MSGPFAVPVAGGTLRGLVWDGLEGGDRSLVVAVHGITSSSRFWTLVGDALAGEVTLVAPDLRGRGDSADLPGPYGLTAHVDDLAALLDSVGAERATLVGHSMGGFVAALMAVRHPTRVAGVVLVDGGPPLGDPPPADADVDAVLEAIIGPSMQRLRMRFASEDDYRAFWHDHPAFRDVPGWLVDAYADHDLTGRPPALRSRVSADAVRADAADTLLDTDVRGAAGRLPCPGVFLWAEAGMLGEPPGLYGPEQADDLAHLDVRRVPSTNHYTIGMSPRGASAVADAVRTMATGRQQ